MRLILFTLVECPAILPSSGSLWPGSGSLWPRDYYYGPERTIMAQRWHRHYHHGQGIIIMTQRSSLWQRLSSWSRGSHRGSKIITRYYLYSAVIITTTQSLDVIKDPKVFTKAQRLYVITVRGSSSWGPRYHHNGLEIIWMAQRLSLQPRGYNYGPDITLKSRHEVYHYGPWIIIMVRILSLWPKDYHYDRELCYKYLEKLPRATAVCDVTRIRTFRGYDCRLKWCFTLISLSRRPCIGLSINPYNPMRSTSQFCYIFHILPQ